MVRYIVLFFVFCCCSTFAKIGVNRDYSVISEADYSMLNDAQRESSSAKYIIVSEVYSRKVAKQIASFQSSDSIYLASLTLLSKGKSSFFREYLNTMDQNHELYHLLHGVYYLATLNYIEAQHYLESGSPDQFSFESKLLLADCKMASATNQRVVFNLYQEAFDSTNSNACRFLIKDRIRRVKYNHR